MNAETRKKALTWLEHLMSIAIALALLCLAVVLTVALTSCDVPDVQPMSAEDIKAAVDTCERRGLYVEFRAAPGFADGRPASFVCVSGAPK